MLTSMVNKEPDSSGTQYTSWLNLHHAGNTLHTEHIILWNLKRFFYQKATNKTDAREVNQPSKSQKKLFAAISIVKILLTFTAIVNQLVTFTDAQYNAEGITPIKTLLLVYS